MTSNKSECNQVAQNTLTNKRTDGKLNNPERSLTISGVVAGGARHEKMGVPKAPSALRGRPMPESSVLTKLCRDAQMRRKKYGRYPRLIFRPHSYYSVFVQKRRQKSQSLRAGYVFVKVFTLIRTKPPQKRRFSKTQKPFFKGPSETFSFSQ